MGYRHLGQCVQDLEQSGQLVRLREPVDPVLEMAAIHRRVCAAGGPALLFESVRGTRFPCVSNLFGTIDRARFLFRRELPKVAKLFELKGDPAAALKRPWHYWDVPFTLLNGLPRRVSSGPILQNETTISQLPAIASWPKDGGPFVLLPLVYSEDPRSPSVMKANMGMYRIQLQGNDYETDKEVGLHYQIRRDIGRHHSHARELGQNLPVTIIVGGPPAWILSAVMYLPEAFSEACFAGVLGGRRFAYIRQGNHVIPAEADFVITGEVDPTATKPEGPFGDHLGYYSLTHPFPYLKVHKVWHRPGAIWPFTVVGRPPQEDSVFGQLVQEFARPVIPSELPGIKAVHAVDEAGVHPLLLAIGKERYTPYEEKKQRPQELLTLASALLGYGPCSLAKYLLIVDGGDAPQLDIRDGEAFFRHLLSRIDWRRDLHFTTRTTIDTLDYSGEGLNQGSKVVFAACGEPIRTLGRQWPEGANLPNGFRDPQLIFPGAMALTAPPFSSYDVDDVGALTADKRCGELLESAGITLLILGEDAPFIARSFANFLWVTFTRSNPSHDIHGFGSAIQFKHWGCRGPLIIDARLKPHMAPVLEEEAAVNARIDPLFQRTGPLGAWG